MQAVSFGYISITAGTPVSMATVLTNLGYNAELRVHALRAVPLQGNTSPTYVGLATKAAGGAAQYAPATAFSKSSGLGVLKQIQTTSTNGKNDEWHMTCPGVDSIRIADYAFDGDHTGDTLAVYGEIA